MTTSLTGSDGSVVVFDPNRPFRIWEINEIFDGTTGENKYVPNVNDLIVDVASGEWFRVANIDETSLITTKVPWIQISVKALDEIDTLLGPGPSQLRDTYRAYVNMKVIPYSVTIDQRNKIHSVSATKIKVFWENKVTGNQDVISAYYDNAGNFIGNEIPLVLCDMPNGQNFATKAIPTFHTTMNLENGGFLTVVAYDDAGQVCSKAVVLVEHTEVIPSSNTDLKYVTSIGLKSPFLSQSDPTRIEYPLNVPVAGLDLMGVVNYSDGSSIDLPVDGGKFSIFGIHDQGFTATNVGQQFPVVLQYQLSANEIAYNSAISSNRTMSLALNAITENVDGMYTNKLFGYPVWINAQNGYRMQWFLLNLDRNICYDVTPYVRITNVGNTFAPKLYGTRQQLVVSVNLNEVNGLFKPYIHTQTIDVTLMAQGTARTTNWVIGFAPSQNPAFGINNKAATTFVNQNLTQVKLDMGETTQAAWLARIFGLSLPLFDPTQEAAPPQPNCFSIRVNNKDLEFTLDQWNSTLTVDGPLANNDTLFVKFYKKVNNNIQYLAVVGLPIYQNP